MFRKTLYSLLLLPVLLHATETNVLEEHFDDYPPGLLPAASEWPARTSGDTPASSWQTGSKSGPQSIVSGAEAGVEGQVYEFTETEPNAPICYSYLQLPAAVEENAEWRLTARFYLDAFEEPGVVTLIGVYNGDVATEAARRENLLTAVSLSRNSRNNAIQAAVSREDGVSFMKQNLALQTWYTLEIRGNNSTGRFNVRIHSGTFNDQLSDLAYSVSASRFDHVAIGDTSGNHWAEGRQNRVLLDDLKLVLLNP